MNNKNKEGILKRNPLYVYNLVEKLLVERGNKNMIA